MDALLVVYSFSALEHSDILQDVLPLQGHFFSTMQASCSNVIPESKGTPQGAKTKEAT